MKLLIVPVFPVLSAALIAQTAPSIRVAGVAEERVPPDQIGFTCRIRSTGQDLEAVAKTNRTRAVEITRMLRELGLGEAELKTGSASFGEYSEYRDGKAVKAGYEANTEIRVQTKRIELYEELWLKLATFSEVTVTSRFELEDRSEVRVVARRKALEAARAKAEEMGAVLGVKVGAPLEISEFGNPRSSFTTNTSRNSIDTVLNDQRSDTSLEPGLISVVERVQVVFAIKP